MKPPMPATTSINVVTALKTGWMIAAIELMIV
jgi:hypothetical protein